MSATIFGGSGVPAAISACRYACANAGVAAALNSGRRTAYATSPAPASAASRSTTAAAPAASPRSTAASSTGSSADRTALWIGPWEGGAAGGEEEGRAGRDGGVESGRARRARTSGGRAGSSTDRAACRASRINPAMLGTRTTLCGPTDPYPALSLALSPLCPQPPLTSAPALPSAKQPKRIWYKRGVRRQACAERRGRGPGSRSRGQSRG